MPNTANNDDSDKVQTKCMFQCISFCRCFPFSGLEVCFFCLKRCSVEPEIKIHYYYHKNTYDSVIGFNILLFIGSFSVKLSIKVIHTRNCSAGERQLPYGSSERATLFYCAATIEL